MSEKLTWQLALKTFNEKRKAEGGKYNIPKKGSDDYLAVRKLMGNESVQEPKAQARAKSRTPKVKQEEPAPAEEPKKARSRKLTPSQIKQMEHIWVASVSR